MPIGRNYRSFNSSFKNLYRDLANLNLVNIAPNPAFSRLNGAHHRMLRAVEVFGGVTVLG
jgi:hypothetical protein